METTEDGRSVILGMGDGSMTTLTIADPAKEETYKYLAELPSRSSPGPSGDRNSSSRSSPSPSGDRRTSELGQMNQEYLQNGNPYPSPYDYSIYTDYLKALHTVIPRNHI